MAASTSRRTVISNSSRRVGPDATLLEIVPFFLGLQELFLDFAFDANGLVGSSVDLSSRDGVPFLDLLLQVVLVVVEPAELG